MTPAERSPSPTTDTVTQPATPLANMNALPQTEQALQQVPQDQITPQELMEMHGRDTLPPHCLDQITETPGIERKEYLWGIHCSTEQLNAAVLNAGLVKEGYNKYEVLENHLIKNFNFPFISVRVAHCKANQVSAALVSIYPNHYKTPAQKVMKKRGIDEDTMVKYIQELLGVNDKARWYAPVVPSY